MTADSALLRTSLADIHEAAGAKMVPFGGWLMPVQYDGILAEHQQTRTSAGLFDLSHMGRLRIEGEGALDLIQMAATNDASRLKPGAIQYSLFCNERGGVIDDILVYRLEDGWRLVVNASNRVRVVAHLETLAKDLGSKAQVVDETFETALLGVQGPLAEDVLQAIVSSELSGLSYYHARPETVRLSAIIEGRPALISRTGYTGEDGFEIMVDAENGVALWTLLVGDERVGPVGLGARDTLRLEAGMSLYGHELNEDRTPYQAGLGRVIKLEKGDFVGRDALAQAAEQPSDRLVGLAFAPGAVPRQGNQVHRGDATVGEVASGTFSPTLHHPIATAYVAPEATDKGAELSVSIRDRATPARVVSLPFVPHRTKTRNG
jgi:aminomethyltransferase